MGKHVIEIDKKPAQVMDDPIIGAGDAAAHAASRSVLKTVLWTAVITILVAGTVVGLGTYLYWQHLKSTPQYSLALIVDAAKRDDQQVIAELVDSDAVVEDFLPQITGKAVELYGRGMAPDMIQRIARIAAPVMPAVKDRAREELPGAIRQKTAQFGSVPFAAMVVGAEQYLDIRVEGNAATVKSRLPEHTFEVKMIRAGGRWKISGLRDEELATRIAQRIGQEIIAIAANGTGSNKARLGVKNINELLREAEEIFE